MMRDTVIAVDQCLTPAEQAVHYVLERIRLDVDLRWFMLDTEAMHLLCVAEAQRTGGTVDQVKHAYRMISPRAEKDVPKVKRLQEEIDRLEGLAGVAEDVALDAQQTSHGASVITAALNVCPTCAGLPAMSITRCPMCRTLQEGLP